MRSKEPVYKASFQVGTEVFLDRPGHPEYRHNGSIIAVLPNPSKRSENQWYDVRFPSGISGRFLERYLLRVDSRAETKTA
jgi:hypothetical protein